jgi:hypothetical protein
MTQQEKLLRPPTPHTLIDIIKWILMCFASACVTVKQTDDVIRMGALSCISKMLQSHLQNVSIPNTTSSSSPKSINTTPSKTTTSPKLFNKSIMFPTPSTPSALSVYVTPLHISPIPSSQEGLEVVIVWKACQVLYLISENGCLKLPCADFPNAYKKNFEQHSVMKLMLDLFNLCQNSPNMFVGRKSRKLNLREVVQEMSDYLAMSICLLLRGEKPSVLYGKVLEYVYDIKNVCFIKKLQRSKTNRQAPMKPGVTKNDSGGVIGKESYEDIEVKQPLKSTVDFVSVAERVWKGMKDADVVRKEFIKK